VDQIPYVNLKGMKFLIDTIAETSPKAKSLRPEEVGDNSLLQAIEASGFLKQIGSGK
jgi:hypothetical protein